MPDTSDNNDKELHALVSLLDEPNRLMFGKIREKLLSYGVGAIPFLENSWDNCFDDIVQERIENLIYKIQFESTCNEFSEWAISESPKLFEGYFLITKYMYPEVEYDGILKVINSISNDVSQELNDNLTALEKVKVVNHIIYDIHKFGAKRRKLFSAQTHTLNNLLDTRKGSNLSLGILYLIIANSRELPIYGVDLSKHFMLAYTKRRKQTNEECLSAEDVLFFINPSTGGSVITKEDVELSVKQMDIPADPSIFCPCNEIDVIKRLIKDMVLYFKKQGFQAKVNELELFLESLPG